MKKKSIISLLMVLTLGGTMNVHKVGATELNTNVNSSITEEKRFELDSYDTRNFYISDGWANGGSFNCIWRRNNVTFKDGIMNMTLDKDSKADVKPYSGAEIGSNYTYGYGYYSVRMKPIKHDGIVSSFFTYAENSNHQAHEIDIEFTDSDSENVEFNYFTDGRSMGGYTYNLGFDSSEDFHEYGFLWQPDSITWFVDGKEAFYTQGDVPSIPGSMMMNVWAGIAPGWLKPYDGETPLTAEYDWASFKKIDNRDLNVDGKIDLKDMSIISQYYNLQEKDSQYRVKLDFNKDGIIDLFDLVSMAEKME